MKTNRQTSTQPAEVLSKIAAVLKSKGLDASSELRSRMSGVIKISDESDGYSVGLEFGLWGSRAPYVLSVKIGGRGRGNVPWRERKVGGFDYEPITDRIMSLYLAHVEYEKSEREEEARESVAQDVAERVGIPYVERYLARDIRVALFSRSAEQPLVLHIDTDVTEKQATIIAAALRRCGLLPSASRSRRNTRSRASSNPKPA